MRHPVPVRRGSDRGLKGGHKVYIWGSLSLDPQEPGMKIKGVSERFTSKTVFNTTRTRCLCRISLYRMETEMEEVLLRLFYMKNLGKMYLEDLRSDFSSRHRSSTDWYINVGNVYGTIWSYRGGSLMESFLPFDPKILLPIRVFPTTTTTTLQGRKKWLSIHLDDTFLGPQIHKKPYMFY